MSDHSWSNLRTAGHYAGPAMPFLIVAGSVHALIAPDNFTVSSVLTLALMAALVCSVAHSGVLCETCARKMPLDGGTQADRHQRWLRFAHRFLTVTYIRGFPLPVTVTAVLLGSFVVETVALLLVGPNRSVGAFAHLALFSVPVAAMMWALYRHSRLRPWCPYCRWGGGGEDEEIVEAPDPSPASR